MSIPNILLPVINVQTNPFDGLLTALGLRFMHLAKTSEEFQALLDNRELTIQMASEDGVARHYVVKNGEFSQHYGFAKSASLTLTFISNEAGVRILTKGDPAAFMQAVQEKELAVEGDYSLLMWFGQAGKLVVPEIPEPAKEILEQAKPLVEQAKPYAEMAVPVLKEAFKKVKSFKK